MTTHKWKSHQQKISFIYGGCSNAAKRDMLENYHHVLSFHQANLHFFYCCWFLKLPMHFIKCKYYFSVRFEKFHFVAGLQDYCLSFATLISLVVCVNSDKRGWSEVVHEIWLLTEIVLCVSYFRYFNFLWNLSMCTVHWCIPPPNNKGKSQDTSF